MTYVRQSFFNRYACARHRKSNADCEVLYEIGKLGLSVFPRNGCNTYWETQAELTDVGNIVAIGRLKQLKTLTM